MSVQPTDWPDYEENLAWWSRRLNGHLKQGKADYYWCKRALEWGWSRQAVEAKLLQVSTKAQREWDSGNRAYVSSTVDAALGLDQLSFE